MPLEGRISPPRPSKDPHRTAAFREAARAIVFKDRGDRRSGLAVDTAGAIARAMERAYAEGYADTQRSTPVKEGSLARPGSDTARADQPIDWVLIPPRPRQAFWTICLFILGREPVAGIAAAGCLVTAETERGTPGWRLTECNGFEKPFGHSTILPLLRLGLLAATHGPTPCLVLSVLGHATWWRFLERGGQFPEDLTMPLAKNRAR